MDERRTPTIRTRCPHCKRDTTFKIHAPIDVDRLFVWDHPWLEVVLPDYDQPKNSGNSVYLTEINTKCPENDCNGPVYLAVRWEFKDSNFKYYTEISGHYTNNPTAFEIVAMFPEGRRRTLDPAIPEAIRTEWDGIAELAEHRKSPALVVVGCRAVLEAAVKELEQMPNARGSTTQSPKRANLQERIDNLASAGVITSTLRDWAHELRLDGNDGAHGLKAEPERALTFARFVEFFLEATFVMNAKLKLIQRLPTEPPPEKTPLEEFGDL